MDIDKRLVPALVFISGVYFVWWVLFGRGKEKQGVRDLFRFTLIVIFVLRVFFPSHFLNFLTEYFAGILGVLAAFYLDRLHERELEKKHLEEVAKEYKEKLDRMSAYIYMELAENHRYVKLGNVFTNYWAVYKTELGNWDESEIGEIIRIYNMLDSYEDEGVTDLRKISSIRRLIADVLRSLDEKAESNSEFADILEKVQEEYREMRRIESRGDLKYSAKYYP